MSLPDNEVVGAAKKKLEIICADSREARRMIEGIKREIKEKPKPIDGFDYRKYLKKKAPKEPIPGFDFRKYRKDRPITDYTDVTKKILRKPPTTPKEEPTRPEAVYTQTGSPYGIADELYHRTFKK